MAIKKQLSTGASFWWVVMCIFTFGGAYFAKLIIMKAIIDSQER